MLLAFIGGAVGGVELRARGGIDAVEVAIAVIFVDVIPIVGVLVLIAIDVRGSRLLTAGIFRILALILRLILNLDLMTCLSG